MQTVLVRPITQKNERRYDLDWLRVIAFGLLIFYHTGMFFNHWTWHIKNNVLTHAIDLPMLFLSRWRMPLLFMISGAGVYGALCKRSAGTFTAERIKRILMPLIFGMFVIVPPQIYLERLTQGQTYSFWEFYKHVFQLQLYPEGDFSWHHLWYLAYILPYSLLGLPIWFLLSRPRGQQVTASLAQFFGNPLRLIALPVLWHLLGELLQLPENEHRLANDWINHFHYFSLFASGFLLCTHPLYWETLIRYRRLTLGMGVMATLMLTICYWLNPHEPKGVEVIGKEMLVITNDWCWLLTIFGFGYRYLNLNTPSLLYANQAVYPFYILHQTITVCVGYYLAPLHWPWGIKYLLLVLLTIGGCWLIYHWLIRPFSLVRPLFGMKGRAKLSATR